MTQAQIRHYRALWGDVRRVLRAQGLSSAECEARRHEIHRQKIGHDVSSTALTDKQFDLVKGGFLAISRPHDVSAQMRAEDGECIRRRHVVAQLLAELGEGEAYAQVIIDTMQSEGRLRDPDLPRPKNKLEAADLERERDATPPRLLLADLKPEELDSVIVSLRLQADRRRLAKASKKLRDDLLPF